MGRGIQDGLSQRDQIDLRCYCYIFFSSLFLLRPSFHTIRPDLGVLSKSDLIEERGYQSKKENKFLVGDSFGFIIF